MFQELSVPGMRTLTLEQTKKQLRAVLLSSKGKGGVALDLLEIEYFNLVCIINCFFIHSTFSKQSCRLEKAWQARREFTVSPLSASSWLEPLMFAPFTGEEARVWSVGCPAKRPSMLLGW